MRTRKQNLSEGCTPVEVPTRKRERVAKEAYLCPLLALENNDQALHDIMQNAHCKAVKRQSVKTVDLRQEVLGDGSLHQAFDKEARRLPHIHVACGEHEPQVVGR